jgi:hypothetical protein
VPPGLALTRARALRWSHMPRDTARKVLEIESEAILRARGDWDRVTAATGLSGGAP